MQEEHEYAIAVGDVQNQFQYALVQFLKTLTSWARVVMLIDDLQWADSEFLVLLKTLVKEVPDIFLSCCHRDNEVKDTHVFAKWICDMEGEVGGSPKQVHDDYSV